LGKTATYDVAVNYTAGESSAGSRFTVGFGSDKLSGVVKAGTDQTLSLGQVTLAPGTFEIKVSADKINGGELWRLRRLELTPVIP
jgi:hypothetical protein